MYIHSFVENNQTISVPKRLFVPADAPPWSAGSQVCRRWTSATTVPSATWLLLGWTPPCSAALPGGVPPRNHLLSEEVSDSRFHGRRLSVARGLVALPVRRNRRWGRRHHLRCSLPRRKSIRRNAWDRRGPCRWRNRWLSHRGFFPLSWRLRRSRRRTCNGPKCLGRLPPAVRWRGRTRPQRRRRLKRSGRSGYRKLICDGSRAIKEKFPEK